MKFLSKWFGKPSNTKATIESFWNWFEEHHTQFFQVVKQNGNIEKDFFEPLSKKLDGIRDGYYFLAGMLDDETVELVFTAEGVIKNFVFVEELVRKAPSLKGWKFTPHKQAVGGSVQFEDYVFDQSTISFFDRTDPAYPDEILIGIVHTQLNSTNDKEILNGVYIYLDNLLGDLRFAETIDELELFQENAVTQPLLPIEKIDSFLTWRQKEFVERYNSISYDSANDVFALFESDGDDKKLIAVVNKGVLSWEGKMSHPWIGRMTIHYDGRRNNGLPVQSDFDQMTAIDEELMGVLKPEDGCLYIGRQSCNNEREVYFAGRDFREMSRAFDSVVQKYSHKYKFDITVYKDKYWRTLARFQS
jgi:hypothetical protein